MLSMPIFVRNFHFFSLSTKNISEGADGWQIIFREKTKLLPLHLAENSKVFDIIEFSLLEEVKFFKGFCFLHWLLTK